MKKHGVLLAGGMGMRLGPVTKATNKHFLPIYDKPLIYYSLSTMILTGIEKLVLISTPESIGQFQQLLQDGSKWGLEISYAVQEKPEGIPHGMLRAEEYFESGSQIILGLGDNVLYGSGTGRNLIQSTSSHTAGIYCFEVSNPSDFGIVELGKQGEILTIEEKPQNPKSNFAITGFYSLPYDAFNICKTLTKSARSEYEIVDLLAWYLAQERLECQILPRGTAWLDAGSQEGLLESSQFVHALQKRQRFLVGSPDEAAWRMGNISEDRLILNAREYGKSAYGEALLNLLNQPE